MANPFRGEHEVTSPDGQKYTFRLDMNGVISLASEFGGDDVIVKMLSGGRSGRATFEQIRSVLYYSALDHHKDVTREEMGRLMTALGPKRLGAVWRPLLIAAFGIDETEPADPKEKAAQPSPGTGETSSETPSSPA